MNHQSDFTPYARRAGLIWLFLLVLGVYPIYQNYGSEVVTGFAIAITVTFLNALVGYFYIDKYFGASFNDFMKVVFTSMGVRLGAMALLIIGVLGLTKIHQVGFTVSLFISYILFSVIEIFFIQKKASKTDQKG